MTVNQALVRENETRGRNWEGRNEAYLTGYRNVVAGWIRELDAEIKRPEDD